MPHDVAIRDRSRYRPRRVRLHDGREVKLRRIEPDDAGEIVEAFERLSAESRYSRFMQYRDELDADALERGVHPRPGLDFVLVATTPAPDGIDIVGAAQYVQTQSGDASACEFAVTVAEDWRGNGLATELVSQLVRRARRDGYQTMEGWVLASNAPMLALARELGFDVDEVDEMGTVRVRRKLQSTPRRWRARRPASDVDSS